MKNKQQIINELKQLTIDNKLQGVVSDELINILAYYLFENQAAIASSVLESSIDTCTKMNSFISHCMGYMYSVERPDPMRLMICTGIKTTDYVTDGRGMSVLASDLIPNYIDCIDGLELYSNNNFKVIGDKNIWGTYTLSSDPSTDYYYISAIVVGGITDLVFDTSSPINVDNNYRVVNNSIYKVVKGSLRDYVTTEFSKYNFLTNNYTVTNGKECIFDLTTTDYNSKLFFNKYIYNKNGNLVLYNILNHEITNKELRKIKIDLSKSFHFKNLNLLCSKSNWDNNNIVDNFYYNNLQGSANNRLSGVGRSMIISDDNPLLLVDGSEVSLYDAKKKFDQYLTENFNRSNPLLVVNEFIRLVSGQVVIGGSSVGDNIKCSLVMDSAKLTDSSTTNDKLATLVYASKAGINNTDLISRINEFYNEYPEYNGYDWDGLSKSFLQYDDISGTNTQSNEIKCYSIKLTINLVPSSITYPGGNSALASAASTALYNYYNNRLLFNEELDSNNETLPFSITKSDINSILSDNGLFDYYDNITISGGRSMTDDISSITMSSAGISYDCTDPKTSIRQSNHFAFIIDIETTI